jgi:hypothetical protein
MSHWRAIFLIVLVTPAFALAQADQLQRFERRLQQIEQSTRLRVDPSVNPADRALFDYGAYLGSNYLSLDDSNGDNHGLRQQEIIGYARLNLDGVHELFLRERISYRDFNLGDNFDPDGHDTETIWKLERAYYRFDLQRYYAAYRGQKIDGDVAFETGRDFVYWGNGLTLAQTLDGASLELRKGAISATLLAGVTPEDTVDIDSSRPGFDDDTRRGFYGVLLSTRVRTHRPFAYFLAQRDYNDQSLSTSFGGPPVITRYDYNSYYLGLGSTGAIGDHLVYGLECVYEGGRTLSNSFNEADASAVPQTHDTIQAAAVDARLDYLLGDVRNTRFSTEFIAATGDDDRLHTTNTFGGNKSGTKDHSFNGFGLLNTGLAFAPTASNLLAVRLGASTFPLADVSRFRRMQVGADFFLFGKYDTDAPLDEPSAGRRYLGCEPDLFINWEITSDLTFAARYGIFFPERGIDDASDDAKVRQFLFLGVTLAL